MANINITARTELITQVVPRPGETNSIRISVPGTPGQSTWPWPLPDLVNIFNATPSRDIEFVNPDFATIGILNRVYGQSGPSMTRSYWSNRIRSGDNIYVTELIDPTITFTQTTRLDGAVNIDLQSILGDGSGRSVDIRYGTLAADPVVTVVFDSSGNSIRRQTHQVKLAYWRIEKNGVAILRVPSSIDRFLLNRTSLTDTRESFAGEFAAQDGDQITFVAEFIQVVPERSVSTFTPPSVSTPAPSPTPPTTPPPTIGPSVPVTRQWRECLSGQLKAGNPPENFIVRVLPGNSTELCWEPNGEIGFNPPLNNIRFDYTRDSPQFPSPVEFEISNPSNVLSYKITFNTNTELFSVIPKEITIGPRETGKRVQIIIKRDTINRFGDGVTKFKLETRIEEI